MPAVPNPPTDNDLSSEEKQKLLLKQIQSLQKLQTAFELHQKGQYEQAREFYETVIEADPNHFDALQLLGALASQTGDYERAIECLTAAIKIEPTFAEGYNNRACAYRSLKKYEEAQADFNHAIALKPFYLDAYYNQANLLHELKQFDDALNSFNQVITVKPDYALAHFGRGNVFHETKQYEQALECYELAITHQPNYPEAYNNASMVLVDQRQWAAAIAVGSNALSLRPNYDFLRGILQHAKMNICDWGDYAASIKEIVSRIESGEKTCSPFGLLGLVDDPVIQQRCAAIYTQSKFPANDVLGEIPQRPRPSKIRIGYYSTEFHNHATAYLIAEFFELHNKEQFELIAFSLGLNKQDEMRARLSASFDQFIDVSDQTDLDIAKLSRALQIDIAVDLKGYTADRRTGIFAFRAAPIQVSYLGYPGSMGADYIDYIIADRVVISEAASQYYSEKIVYLPHSYQVNDRQRAIAKKVFTRAEAGLPEKGFIFCCFNKNYKITPDTFDSWMRILKATEGSVLWLFQGDPAASENLKAEAQNRGVSSERLVFAKEIPLAEHLARHHLADLFLDTLPYNAHTTASDALWVGLPVLTLIGSSFASRVSASLLTAIGLPELITSTVADYEALAIELSQDPAKLQKLKQKLSNNKLTMPLFATPDITNHIEAAYLQMMTRYWDDLDPANIVIEPNTAEG